MITAHLGPSVIRGWTSAPTRVKTNVDAVKHSDCTNDALVTANIRAPHPPS
jgi:hypothetical protein